MRHFNVGDNMCGYEIIMEYMDDEKSLCVGNNGNNYAVFETYDDITTHACTMLTKEEAYLLFSQKYELHNKIKKDILREECENAIAKYIFGTDDINYKQAAILQAMFNTDEVIENYRNNCSDWNLAIEKYIRDNNVNRR